MSHHSVRTAPWSYIAHTRGPEVRLPRPRPFSSASFTLQSSTSMFSRTNTPTHPHAHTHTQPHHTEHDDFPPAQRHTHTHTHTRHQHTPPLSLHHVQSTSPFCKLCPNGSQGGLAFTKSSKRAMSYSKSGKRKISMAPAQCVTRRAYRSRTGVRASSSPCGRRRTESARVRDMTVCSIGTKEMGSMPLDFPPPST